MIRKRRDSKRSVAVVVLEGIKVFTDQKTGVAPLCKALRYAVNPDDEVLVLTFLSVNPSPASLGLDNDNKVHQCNESCEANPYIRFLNKEISERKEIYKKIFRPFYDSCKSNGVKFEVKIAAGLKPKDIIIEEANSVQATWIVMESCFSRDLTFRLSGTDCDVMLVSDVEEANAENDGPDIQNSIFEDKARNPKSPKLMKGLPSTEESHLCDSIPEIDSEPQPCVESKIVREDDTIFPQEGNIDPVSNKSNILLGVPLQMSWDVILEITQGFETQIFCSQNMNCSAYIGFLEDHHSLVLVKRFKGDSCRLLEAEKKAVLSLHHKNILGMIGYHKSESETILVFPFGRELQLDKKISELDQRKQKWSFGEKWNIALGIAQGIRYLHEECPRGPIVHGELQLSNIFLTTDLQPMISGFEQATWLQREHAARDFIDSCQREHSLVHGSIALLKADILSFGVLLLRLFCRRSVPQDDKLLIEWARPLLLQLAFHELLDKDLSDDLDMHAVYRVMTVATLCTKSRPMSRPSMSKVISILKGENFCCMQSSPSDNSL